MDRMVNESRELRIARSEGDDEPGIRVSDKEFKFGMLVEVLVQIRVKTASRLP